MAPAAMAPSPGFYPDDNSQKKDGTRDNDWTCPKCGNVNFSIRIICNMRKCNTPKPGSQVSKSGKNTKPDTPEGSWKCEKGNNINYPFLTKCNRQNCGAEKPSETRSLLSNQLMRMNSAGRYEVDGYVYNSEEEPNILMTGKWNESMSYQPCDLEGGPLPGSTMKEVWKAAEAPKNDKFQYTYFAQK